MWRKRAHVTKLPQQTKRRPNPKRKKGRNKTPRSGGRRGFPSPLGKRVRARGCGSTLAPQLRVRYQHDSNKSLYAVGTTGKRTCRLLIDSGAERELVGRKYADWHKLPKKRLAEPVQIEFMDGSLGNVITHATWQRISIQGENGAKDQTIKFLIADIPEGFVLGMNWLEWADPDISWKRKTLKWRNPIETTWSNTQDTPQIMIARKARQRIIQSEIQSNEAPQWVRKEFADVFVSKEKVHADDVPHRPGLDYEIELKEGFKPRAEKERAFSREERDMFRALAKQELELKRWERSKSANGAQMLFAAKHGGEKRPCHDYRRLNQYIVDDKYPVPIIKQLLQEVSKSRYITSLDLPQAYHLVRIKDEKTKRLLAFFCNGELYQPTVMQFGSKTAVAHFQRFITTVLKDVIGKGCRAYLDNIVVHSDDSEEHDRILRKVLEALRKHKLWIKPSKCEWKKQEVLFCGFLVGNGSIALDPEKLRAIRDWEPPKVGGAPGRTKIREFLGFCNFYRQAIGHYSEMAIPLTNLTAPTREWKWGKAETTAWQLLKTAILAAPVLMAYDEDLPVICHTDACDEALAGAVEHELPNGEIRPIGFYSKKLNPAERNYSVHDKELLAIVKTFKDFRHILQGSKDPVIVYSDHKALQWFTQKHDLNQRQARWMEFLSDFRYEIRHVKGKDNAAADALSRKWGSGEHSTKAQLLRQDKNGNLVPAGTIEYA
jgi:hypothetical protein